VSPATAIPRDRGSDVVRDPDWDFLAVMILIVTLLCVAGFAAHVSSKP
jgi:hypothetical protein